MELKEDANLSIKGILTLKIFKNEELLFEHIQENLVVNNGLVSNLLVTVGALSLNSKYIIEAETNGTTTSIYVNGVLQTLVGTNSGYWFSYANTGNTLDNVVIGAAIRSASNFYMDGKIAYVGNFTLPSAGNRTAMLNALNSYYSVY